MTPEWELICKDLRPDLNPQATFDSFKDYWLSLPGDKATKLDWTAAWRNWVRRESGPRGSAAPARKPDPRIDGVYVNLDKIKYTKGVTSL